VVAKRIAAVLAAVAMIAGAVWWRGRDGAGASSEGTLPASSPVVCALEVMAACDTLRSEGATVLVEPAGATADRLVTDDGATPVVWVTIEPWPAVVEARRRAADRLARLSVSNVVAGLDVALFGDLQTCGATPTWTCVAGLPGLGIDDPVTTGTGPAVLIALATGVAGADIATVGATDPAQAVAAEPGRRSRRHPHVVPGRLPHGRRSRRADLTRAGRRPDAGGARRRRRRLERPGTRPGAARGRCGRDAPERLRRHALGRRRLRTPTGLDQGMNQ
jgi:hypothetical protein